MSFVIEMYWPGMSVLLVDDLVARIRQAAADADSGISVTGCTMAPTDEVCFVRVDAPTGAAVRTLVARLGLVGARVSETIDLPGLGGGEGA